MNLQGLEGVPQIGRLLLALVLLPLSTAIGATDQKTRVIDRSPLVPIAERLRPDDEVVVVQDFPRISGLDDEPVSVPYEIAWLIDTSDAALVIDVVEQRGRLVDEGLWVQSTVVGRVIDAIMERSPGSRVVLKNSQLANKQIDLLWSHGGEVTIGAVTVQARPSQLRPGQRYLVFADRKEPHNEWHLGTRFEILKGGVLKHLFEADDRRQHAKSPLDGLSLVRVLVDLKSEVAHQQ